MQAPPSAWPFKGREAELGEIARARADGCPGVVVTADPGAGKSRLAREAFAAAADQGALADWIQATRSAASVPLAAFAGLLPEEVRADDALELMRRSTDVLRERAGGRAIVLAVDDAQLLDPISAALVLHLVTNLQVFVVATIRSGEPIPDAIMSLWKDAGARRVELGPLSDAAIAALVESALEGPLEAAVLRWISESSRGNALYVRELVLGAVEAGTLALVEGLWRLRGRPPIPGTLVELVSDRMAGLSREQRAPIELLAVGEPLRLEEIASLTSYHVLLDAEAQGLVVTAGDEIRLAHPLFGEVLSASMPLLRARQLRLALAAKLQARTPLTGDDALRVARLLLDADEQIPRALILDAARAANLAGDPQLGAELAEQALADDGGLPAALLLARAHTMRNRDADAETVLAAAEALVPEHPNAYDYVVQRSWGLFWGLRRHDEALALLERADRWSSDPAWRGKVERIRHGQTTMAAGFAGEMLADDAELDERQARSTDTLYAMTLLFGGRGDEASAIARRVRPGVPLREPLETARLGCSSLIPLETGNDWADVEQFMARTLRESVRANDHEAAGIAAFTVAGLKFLAGRYRDAARWLAEAEVHFEHHDTFGSIVHVHAYQVGVATFTGDLDGSAVALERLHAALGGRDPLPNALPYVLRAEGWAARARSDAAAAERLLHDAATLAEAPVFAAQLTYEALRAGARVTPVRCETRLVAAYAAHGEARAARDGAALLAVAEEMAAIGALRYGTEAAAEAATAFVASGRQDSARRAAARARELYVPDQGGMFPRIDGLDSDAVDLTAREAQLVELAARGLSNAEIADRLVLSVRTVEAHLYRAMRKLGVSDRRDLK